MPIYLAPISRRRFLGTSLAAAGAAALGCRHALAADEKSATRFALLSDTHIAADPATVAQQVHLAEHLRAACAGVTAAGEKPAAAFITGDLALKDGQPGDYVTLLDLLKPLREAGIPLHLGLGNHDNRDEFWKATDVKRDAPRPVATHHVTLVETPRVNVLLLDSLDKVNHVPGLLGAAQLEWLATTLDAAAAKPAIVLVHHNPDTHEGALADTPAMLETILPRKQVKALVFGHTHNWQIGEQEGLHLVNLPPVAYVFGEGRPSGWVDALVSDRGMTLTLQCLDPKHPLHGERKELVWR